MSEAPPDGIPERDATGAPEVKEESKQHEYANGCFYDGFWRANRRHGQGTFKWPSGTTYTGEFRNDRRHGQGKIIYADGTKYEGEWRNDQRNGRGEFSWL